MQANGYMHKKNPGGYGVQLLSGSLVMFGFCWIWIFSSSFWILDLIDDVKVVRHKL